jgi:phage-related protein
VAVLRKKDKMPVIDPENAVEAAEVVNGVNAWINTAMNQLQADINLGPLVQLTAQSYAALKEKMPLAMQTKTGISIATLFLAKEADVVNSDAWQEIIYADATGQTDAQVRAKIEAAKATIRTAMQGV